jgi:hypothetical protein
VVGIAPTIGMVSPGGNLALMVEQRVQHMERLARRHCNQLGVEGAIAIGEVGVSLEAGFVTVVGVISPNRRKFRLPTISAASSRYGRDR